MSVPKEKLASYFDHTILKPDATEDDVKNLAAEALSYKFASICVNSCHVKLAYELLKKDKTVKVCSVIGFPLGAMETDTKVYETKRALKLGATEIDMVINVGALKAKNLKLVEEDIKAVLKATHSKKGALLKVIIETCLLTDEEKVTVCEICKKLKTDFVKTSTGFSKAGATKEDIALMRKTVGPEMGVKASGGIRNYDAAMDMINAGATRIGASAGVAIMKEAESK